MCSPARCGSRKHLNDLLDFRIVSGTGHQVPLSSIADVKMDRGYARINRIQGLRTVSVTADVDTEKRNANQILAATHQQFLPALQKRFPDIGIEIEGQAAESSKTGFSMVRGFMVGLAGIVVNDSILLVAFLKLRVREVYSVAEAAKTASRERFRAILLTSLTIIAGLTPLLLEKSLQAQILTPLATSIVFGLLASTLLVLLVVPEIFCVFDDFNWLAAEKSATGSNALNSINLRENT